MRDGCLLQSYQGEVKLLASLGGGSLDIFICSVVFESLWQAWVVVLMIPVSLMGAFLTFVLFDVGFGSGGFASLVLLSGLVVNASIYILCQYNLVVKLRKRDAVSAYLCAFNHKILPIFLTIVSTILGLLPFFGSGMRNHSGSLLPRG